MSIYLKDKVTGLTMYSKLQLQLTMTFFSEMANIINCFKITHITAKIQVYSFHQNIKNNLWLAMPNCRPH